MTRSSLYWGLLVSLIAIAPLTAQESIDGSRRNAIVTAVERASPSVISINVIQMRAQRQLPPMFRDFWDIFEMPPPNVEMEKQRINSVGSGFIFNREGYAITNFHVIESATEVVSVTLPDGRELPAGVLGVDERTDIAVLRIEGANLPYVPLGDSDDLLTGEWAIAIGNPFGPLMQDPQPTVSVGVVSANHRRVSPNVGGGERLYQGMIQTDAAINPGNSGGPLVNARGEVIGINTMIFSQSGGSVGLGFAIPINRAKRVAEELITYKRRRDPWAGFKVDDVQNLPPHVIAELGIRVPAGCVVASIRKDVPAYEADLRAGDVIVAVNGNRVNGASDIDFALWDSFVGDTMTLNVHRQDRTFDCAFKIVELPE